MASDGIRVQYRGSFSSGAVGIMKAIRRFLRRAAPEATRLRIVSARDRVAGDDGSTFTELTAKSSSWSPETIKAVQSQLKNAGYYAGAIDGSGGAALAPALKQWRLLGPPQKG
jgi:hypothetical protein